MGRYKRVHVLLPPSTGRFQVFRHSKKRGLHSAVMSFFPSFRRASKMTAERAFGRGVVFWINDAHIGTPATPRRVSSTRTQNFSASSRARKEDSHWNERLEKVLERKLSAPEPTSSIESCAIDPKKKTIVVLGSGWGAISFIKALDKKGTTDMFEVILVSPRNYFLYTPLLPGVATGAIETRSIVESIRRPIAEKGFKYYEAAATDIDAKNNIVACRKDENEFTLKYDYLITAVGAVTNTFGVPGVEENCLFFKEISDAAKFRSQVNERFERATLPGISKEEIQNLLRFVAIGAGPTGVELAAELYDLVFEDVAKTFPRRLLEDVSINIIDLQEKILSSYDREIADYATDFFKRANINCILNTQVKEVKKNSLTVADKNTGEEREIPCGMSVWCSGIKLTRFVKRIQNSLPEGSQPNVRSLSADKAMRVKGSDGSIFGIGDCVTVERPKSMAKAQEIYAKACKCDEEGNCELQIDLPTAIKALEEGGKDFPHLKEMAKSATQSIDAFESYTENKDEMTMSEFMKMCEELDNGLRAFPATAQVAKQQGNYLAEIFNSAKENGFEVLQDPNARFNYEHKGSLAYIGKDSAVADIPGFAILKGLAAGLVWKSFETVSQVSLNNVFKVAADILRTKIFGRDISRLT